MTAVSKKKLIVKNNDLRRRLKAKVDGKSAMRQTVQHMKADAAYWEDRATKAEQELAGDACVL